MQINLKSPAEVAKMAASCADLASVFIELRKGHVRAGVTTGELDKLVEELIVGMGDTPSFKGYHGFPASSCISVNEEIVHGIPGDRVIEDGDLVGIDIGLIKDGWHADSAETFLVGEVADDARELCEITKAALERGIAAAVPGNRVADIGRAIEALGREKNYGIVESLVGHGIGRALHEDPQIPNYECLHMPNPRLEVGMVVALEPMFNLGTKEVVTLEDDWTVVTADGSLSAHYEHTVAITEEGPQVLTAR